MYCHRHVLHVQRCAALNTCVITLIIPAMWYYSSRQRGSNLTNIEFKFQPKTRKLLSGIFNQWRHIHMLSCCVCLCARIISQMLTGLWCLRGVLFFHFWLGCRDRYRPASRHVTVRRGLLVKPALPEGAGCLIRNKCSQTQMHLRDPQCVCMYGFVCFPLSFAWSTGENGR